MYNSVVFAQDLDFVVDPMDVKGVRRGLLCVLRDDGGQAIKRRKAEAVLRKIRNHQHVDLTGGLQHAAAVDGDDALFFPHQRIAARALAAVECRRPVPADHPFVKFPSAVRKGVHTEKFRLRMPLPFAFIGAGQRRVNEHIVRRDQHRGHLF